MALVALLGDAETLPLGATAAKFRQAVAPNDRFKAMCSLLLLLEDPRLLSVPQRCAAWFLVWDSHRPGPQVANPFLPVLLEGVAAGGAAPPETALLLRLLQGADVEQVAQLSPGTLAAMEGASQPPAPEDLEALRRRYLANGLPSHPAAAAAASAAAQRAASGAAAGTSGRAGATAASGKGGGAVEALPLPWQRPTPAVLTPSPDELLWLPLGPAQTLLWDSGMGEDSSRSQQAVDLLAKALRGPLLPAQQTAVASALESPDCCRLLARAGVCPQTLPDLVENAPSLAIEALVRLHQHGRIGAYFGPLAGMELSLHSLEVVKGLAAAVALPADFVHLYVGNCMHTCEATADKYLQHRLVRLVCVFLVSLIRHKVAGVGDLLPEVQAFAINHCRIREAAGLFRLLKQLESGGRVSDSQLMLDGMAGSGGASGSAGGDAFEG